MNEKKVRKLNKQIEEQRQKELKELQESQPHLKELVIDAEAHLTKSADPEEEEDED